MSRTLTRRDFSRTMLAGSAGAAAAALLSSSPLQLLAAKKRNIKIGHTSITWPMDRGCYVPDNNACPADEIEAGVKDISSLGFYGYELFGIGLQKLESQGGVGQLLNKYNLPLISAYCTLNLIDPAKTKDGPQSISALVEQAKLVKKYGGTVLVIGPNQVDRKSYNFHDHKTDIVNALNEAAKAVSEVGLTACFHPHTGTCVENREETYAVMNAVDTRDVKFAPDTGQLQKGGADPVEIIKDFLPLVDHVHFKDYSGGEYYLGYCPLGEGKVNLPAILELMDGKKLSGMVMVELDGQFFSPDRKSPPETPLQAARKAKAYLEKQGVRFRATSGA